MDTFAPKVNEGPNCGYDPTVTKAEITGECRLCGKVSRLHESHVIPKFVFRWLKTRSGSNRHIRNSDEPNLRVQDGPKRHWLCWNCEQLFARDETEVAKKNFHPFVNDGKVSEYNSSFLRFCTSVSWRVLIFAFGYSGTASYSQTQKILVAEADARWRAFLLKEAPHPGRFEQHVIPFGIIGETTVRDLPSNINRFLTGPVTFDIVGAANSLMTFAKLGPIMIFGHIEADSRQWKGSKVHVTHGKFSSPRYELPIGLLDLIKEKANLIQTGWSRLSDDQANTIERSVIEAGPRFLESPQGKAIIADAEMFGTDAIFRK